MAQYLISEEALEAQGRILAEVAQRSGAHMLVALKAFSTWAGLQVLQPFASGCCASGLYEARLGAEFIGGDIAVYSPAYRASEIGELCSFAHHIDFNSMSQWMAHRDTMKAHPRFQEGELQAGLRINPQHSTGHTPLYDPCVAGSRLGIPRDQICLEELDGITGLHFHTLCEQGFDDLLSTMRAVERDFSDLLLSPQMRYLNMGGGHWITKPDYDREGLVSLIIEMRERYNLDIYLEPGEAWCIHTGVLRAEVLDIFESMGHQHAILDVSATAHMPDVLEMPYRPDLFLVHPADCIREKSSLPAVQLEGESYEIAGMKGDKPHAYRLGAPSCLAGDVIGDYSFDQSLRVGDTLVFDDMSHYTMVKTSHFNGVVHPDICLLRKTGKLELLRRFEYEDFRMRLGSYTSHS